MKAVLLQSIIRDGGPLYTETNLDQFIVEPWNTVTAILFLVLLAYWYNKIRGNFRRHRFITNMLPLLAIGGVGGVIYHAFRYSQFFLLMDWLPIMLISLAASYYFLYRVVNSRLWAVLPIIGVFAISTIGFLVLPIQIAVNVNYALLALMVLLPLLMILNKTQFKYGVWILGGLISFGLALFFRIADPWEWLPMGTHFLWHTFGVLACHLVITYIYYLNEKSLLETA